MIYRKCSTFYTIQTLGQALSLITVLSKELIVPPPRDLVPNEVTHYQSTIQAFRQAFSLSDKSSLPLSKPLQVESGQLADVVEKVLKNASGLVHVIVGNGHLMWCGRVCVGVCFCVIVQVAVDSQGLQCVCVCVFVLCACVCVCVFIATHAQIYSNLSTENVTYSVCVCVSVHPIRAQRHTSAHPPGLHAGVLHRRFLPLLPAARSEKAE